MDNINILLFSKQFLFCIFLQISYFPKSFIASCGPKPNTEDAFWEMILLKRCRIVVATESLVKREYKYGIFFKVNPAIF